VALNFQKVTLNDLSRGIDNRAATNKIEEGFSESLINIDTNPDGFVEKRKGYECVGGFLPLRVRRVDAITGKLKFTCVGNFLFNYDGKPIVVGYNPSKNMGGVFTVPGTMVYKYYSSSKATPKKYLTGSGTVLIPQAEHGLTSQFIHVDVMKVTDDSADKLKLEAVIIEGYSVNDENQISVNYSVPTSQSVVVLFRKMINSIGVSYLSDDIVASSSITITKEQHQILTTNMLVHVISKDGTSYRSITPNSIVIASNGTITINLNLASGETFFRVGIFAAEDVTTSLEPITKNQSPFCIYQTYITGISGEKTMAIVNSIKFDYGADNNTPTTVIDRVSSDSIVTVWYDADVSANVIEVNDASIVADNEDESPICTVWGLDHTNAYKDNTLYAGNVVGLSNFHSSSDNEDHMISAMGGNLFKLAQYNSTSLMGSTTTANYITTTTSAIIVSKVKNRAIASASYIGGYVELVLSGDALSGTFYTTEGFRDKVKIENMEHHQLNGEYDVVYASDNTIKVINPNITTDYFNESISNGILSFITSKIDIGADNQIAIGDYIHEITELSGATISAVDNVNHMILIKHGKDSTIELSAGMYVKIYRYSNIIDVISSDNFVLGDVISMGGVTQTLRIIGIDVTNKRLTVDYTVNSYTASNVQVASRWNAVETSGREVSHFKSDYYETQSMLQIASFDGKVLMVNGKDAVMKYDGEKLSPSGLPRWNPMIHLYVEQYSGSGNHIVGSFSENVNFSPTITAKVISSVSTTTFTSTAHGLVDFDRVVLIAGTNSVLDDNLSFGRYYYVDKLTDDTFGLSINSTLTPLISCATITNMSVIKVLDEVVVTSGTLLKDDIISSNMPADYGVFHVINSVNLAEFKYTISPPIKGNAILRKVRTFNYYVRAEYIGRDDSVVMTCASGQGDYIIRCPYDKNRIHIILPNFPKFTNVDYDKVNIKLFRSEGEGSTKGKFKLIQSYKCASLTQGIHIIDNVDNTDGRDEDIYMNNMSAQLGYTSTILTEIDQPPKAKYITATGGKMIMANCYTQPNTIVKFVESSSTSLEALKDKIVTIAHNTETPIPVSFKFVNLATGTNFYIGNVANTSTAPFNTTTSGLYGKRLGYSNSGVSPVTLTSSTTMTALFSVSAGYGYFMPLKSGVTNIGELTGGFWCNIISTGTSVVFTANGIDTTYAKYGLLFYSASSIPVYIGKDYSYGQADGNANINDFNNYSLNKYSIRRLSHAINWYMSGVVVPFLSTHATKEYGDNTIVFEQSLPTGYQVQLTLPDVDNASWSIDGKDYESVTSVFISNKHLGSRIIVSPKNYPETFIAPYVEEENSSEFAPHVIDINSNDGQEITGIIPFFGESVFGSGTRESTLVVFKPNHIYLVDINSKDGSYVKLDSGNRGCTVTNSLVETKNGVMFTNELGIYRLNRDQTISYIGEKIDRLWKANVNPTDLYRYGAINNKINQKFIMNINKTTTVVYDYVSEVDRRNPYGSWTVYNNMPSTAWYDLYNNIYFGTSTGQVMKQRTYNSVLDYRDDAQPVSSTVTTAPLHFGGQGSEKFFANIMVHYFNNKQALSGIELQVALDYSSSFVSLGVIDIPANDKTITTLKYSLPFKRGESIQLKFLSSTIDTNLAVAGVSSSVAIVSDKLLTSKKNVER
jgi:hypothetical protein